jgi:PIN domain nuclease of toxin-antitoxin system
VVVIERQGRPGRRRRVTCLLDTHFLLWHVLGSPRLRHNPWLHRYRPWGVSPVSLLEIQFLAEVGRMEVRTTAFLETLLGDPRFTVDEAPLLGLVRHALPVEWTRDPFDRLLAAHSTARRAPLCTIDARLVANHALVVEELRAA